MDSVFLSECICSCWHEIQLGGNELNFLRSVGRFEGPSPESVPAGRARCPILPAGRARCPILPAGWARSPILPCLCERAPIPIDQRDRGTVFLSVSNVCVCPKSAPARMEPISYVWFCGIVAQLRPTRPLIGGLHPAAWNCGAVFKRQKSPFFPMSGFVELLLSFAPQGHRAWAFTPLHGCCGAVFKRQEVPSFLCLVL